MRSIRVPILSALLVMLMVVAAPLYGTAKPFYPFGVWNPATFSPPPPVPNPTIPYQPPPSGYPGFFQLLGGRVVPAVSAGLYYGIGYTCVDHHLQAGPGNSFGAGPDFAAFDHQRESDLNGWYLRIHGGVLSRGVEIVSLNFDLGLGCWTEFTQETDAVPVGSNVPGLRQALLLLQLLDGEAGAIPLDNQIRFHSGDGSLVFPIFPGLDVLAGYKVAASSDAIDSYATRLPAGGPSIYLPGLGGWINTSSFGGPDAVGMTMSQSLRWHAPFIGTRVRDLVSLPMQGRWNIDLLIAPHVFGTYYFQWEAEQSLGNGIIHGSAQTEATGLYRAWIEVRGETRLRLIRSLFLDLYGKYSFLRLSGSEPEIQTVASQNAPAVGPDYFQLADQYLTMNQSFWGLGGGLGWVF